MMVLKVDLQSLLTIFLEFENQIERKKITGFPQLRGFERREKLTNYWAREYLFIVLISIIVAVGSLPYTEPVYIALESDTTKKL